MISLHHLGGRSYVYFFTDIIYFALANMSHSHQIIKLNVSTNSFQKQLTIIEICVCLIKFKSCVSTRDCYKTKFLAFYTQKLSPVISLSQFILDRM